MAQRTLIRGGHIISMDPRIGDIPGGDLLIEGEEIAAVAPSVEASGCEVVDASGAIVIPGFVDSHRHTWETSARGIAPDVTLDGYFDLVLDRIAPAYRPEDVYAGNLLGALEAVDSGITTLLDWSHINNTPDHADEAIRALAEVGIRAVYCYGNPNTSLADWWFESTLKAPEDIRRVRDRYFSSDKGLMTLAMGTRGPGFCTPEVVRHDWELAREIGVPISVHVGMGPVAGRFRMVEQLHDLGLLGPDTTYIHCNHLTDREFQLIAETGGTVSIAPMVEMTMGHGIPPTGEVLAHGLRPSLSCDVVTSVPGDPFTQMRFLFAAERMRVHQRIFDEELEEVPPLLSLRDVLEFATIEGARVCGLADRTGSLTPGKKADVVMLNIERVNAAPVTDPVGTVVCSMDTSNVDSVWVNGLALKRGGKLVDFDLERARRLAEDSRDHLVSHVERLPHWATPRTTGL
ncbi:MAG: amidohydrolase family protein [Rubrobacteraceae bacterium]|nr:amidohydrolase family protein [Rubrobacteraceae bacterium]